MPAPSGGSSSGGGHMWCLKSVFRSRRDEGAAAAATNDGVNAVSSDNVLAEELERRNRAIEKQLRRDKRRLRSTHKLQWMGLRGGGKSTLIRRLAAAAAAEAEERCAAAGTISDQREKVTAGLCQRRDAIRRSVHDTLLAIVEGMCKEGIAFREEANEERAQWLRHRAITVATPSQQLPARFYSDAKALWRDANLQGFYHMRVRSRRVAPDPALLAAEYFLRRLDLIGHPEYLPSEEDCLRHYVPTRGVLETTAPREHVTFCLIEVGLAGGGGAGGGGTGGGGGGGGSGSGRWLEHASDAVAVVFVVDMSDFDAVVDMGQRLTRLHESLYFFKAVWTSRATRKKSVILLLNKEDVLEDKVLRQNTSLKAFFPSFAHYKLTCPLAEKELSSGVHPDVVHAKYFIRDCFLQMAQIRPGDLSRQCYPHFTCALAEDAGLHLNSVINDCCRDILQRVHLRMHEIL